MKQPLPTPTPAEVDTFFRLLGRAARTGADENFEVLIPIALPAEDWAALAEINVVDNITEMQNATDMGIVIATVLIQVGLEKHLARLQDERDKMDASLAKKGGAE
jgi:hypothetical protein